MENESRSIDQLVEEVVGYNWKTALRFEESLDGAVGGVVILSTIVVENLLLVLEADRKMIHKLHADKVVLKDITAIADNT